MEKNHIHEFKILEISRKNQFLIHNSQANIYIALRLTLMIPGHHRKDTPPHKCKRSLAKASGKYTHTLAGATELLF